MATRQWSHSKNTWDEKRGKFTMGTPWFLPTGVSAEQVNCAYQFKGIGSQAESLKNQANHGTHELTKYGDCAWSDAGGWAISSGYTNGLDTDSMDEPRTTVVRFSGAPNSGQVGLTGRWKSKNVFARWQTIAGDSTKAGYGVSWMRDSNNYAAFFGRIANAIAAGVVGAVWDLVPDVNGLLVDHIVYVNGVKQTAATQGSGSWTGDQSVYGRLIGNCSYGSNNPASGAVSIQAIAFYNVALSDAQMSEVAARMAAL